MPLLLLLLLLLLEQLLLLLLLLLLLEQLLLLLLLTLMPAPSLVPTSTTCTYASSTGRLNSAGVQGMLIYPSFYSQRLSHHLPFKLIIYICVPNYLVDFGTGDGRAGKD